MKTLIRKPNQASAVLKKYYNPIVVILETLENGSRRLFGINTITELRNFLRKEVGFSNSEAKQFAVDIDLKKLKEKNATIWIKL